MNFTYLLRNPQLFPSVIGMKYSQFESILPKFILALKKAEQYKISSKKRERSPGGGRKATLKTDRQKLFFILFYYKVYPTFRLAQSLFCFDKRNIQLWKECLENILKSCLSYELYLPKVKVNHMGDVLRICPGLKEFILDATERPVQRSKNKKTQEYFYSGKKKRHTVKNHTFVHPNSKKILAISSTVEGKKHDKKLAQEDSTWSTIPPDGMGLGDTGYQGLKPINKTVKFVTPKKKPRGKELTPEEKANNKKISQIRVRGEHPFSYLKHFNRLVAK